MRGGEWRFSGATWTVYSITLTWHILKLELMDKFFGIGQISEPVTSFQDATLLGQSQVYTLGTRVNVLMKVLY
ncbi:hypothetical protein V6N13_031162 [Hibiscus sabdariffa]